MSKYSNRLKRCLYCGTSTPLRRYSALSFTFVLCLTMLSCVDEESYPVPLDTPKWYQLEVDASAVTTMTVSWPDLEGAGGYEFTLVKLGGIYPLYDENNNLIRLDTVSDVHVLNKVVAPENFIVCPQEPNSRYRMTLKALGDNTHRSNGQTETTMLWDNCPAQTPTLMNLTVDTDSDPDTVSFSWLNVPKSTGVKFALFLVDAKGENPVAVGEEEILTPTILDSIDVWGNLIRGRTIVKRPQVPGSYFKVVLQALADPNPKLNVADGPIETVFTDNFPGAFIPNGANLTEYFTNNPTKGDVETIYSLKNGGEYTMTGDIKLGATPVTIRSEFSDPSMRRAKITVTDGSFINGGAGLLFENVELDYSNWTPVAGGTDVGNAVIMMDKDFNPTGKALGGQGTATNTLFVSPEQPIGFKSSKITGLKGHLFLNNDVYYAIGYFLIDDCEIQLNTKEFTKALIFFNAKGIIKNVLIRNSTIYNLQAPDAALSGHPYLIQFSNSSRVPEHVPPTYLAAEWLAPINGVYHEGTEGKAGGLIISGCTFWQLGKYNQSFNSNGPLRRSEDVIFIEKSIFVDCWEDGAVFRRFGMGGNIKTEYAFTTGTRSSLSTNTEWFNGVFSNKNAYDTNQTMLTTDPAFTDPANGNFTPTGAEIVTAGIGDPRWLP